ncbi:DUF58 domain-containing protein [bacterium]|nr:DUF58 domain-containing protein [bacterium]
MRETSRRLTSLAAQESEGLPKIGLRARHVVEGFLSGLHRGRRFGWNMEFAGHREYVPGDDLRTLDWKAFARTDRYFIKRFEEETSLSVTLALDASGSMGYASGQTSKLGFAVELAAALAYLITRQKDQVGLAWFSSQLHGFLPPAGALPHLRLVWESLEAVQAGGEADYPANLRAVAGGLPRRGMLILFTDGLTDPELLHRGLLYFQSRRFDVILLRIVDPAERDFPFRGEYLFTDAETGGRLPVDATGARAQYLSALAAHEARLEETAYELAADYHVLYTDTSVSEALFRLLSRRRRVRRG